MKKFLSIVLCACMLCAMLAGCGSSNSPAAAVEGDVLKVGIFEPATGENGAGGMQEVLGARYANQVVPSVTVNGKEYKIELVEVDNQSDKTAAVTAAQNLVSSGVIAVIGSYGSGVSIAAGSTFEQAKIPAIGGSCTNPQVTLGNDYYFRVCFLDPFQGTVMASYANNEGCKKAAVIMQNGDDYSTGLANYFADAFAKMDGCEVVYTGTYNTNETDFNAILTAAKAADPDVLFIPVYYEDVALIAVQASEVGVKAKLLGGDGWDGVLKKIDASSVSCLDGALYCSHYSSQSSDERVQTFIKNYTEKFGEAPNTFAALGYDAAYMMTKAIENAGSTDSAAIVEAMKNLEYDGITGHMVFDENRNPIKSAVILEINGGAESFVENYEK